MEKIEYKGFTITIRQDEDAESPDDQGNTDLFLVSDHRQFYVPRKGFTCDGGTPKEYKRDYHVLPLVAYYIHSGVALSLGRTEYPFTDQWDSGVVGWVFVKKREGFRNVRKAAQSLIDEWNQYLSGDVWGYVVETSDGEHLDSCWGFYGREYCEQQAREVVDYEATRDVVPAGDVPFVRTT